MRRERQQKNRRRGYGLIELMVTLAVMSVVMIGMFQIFNEGMQLFRTNAAAADAQRAAIKVLSHITAELVNATPQVAQEYPAGGGHASGIVFATSLTDTGVAIFHPNTGDIYWQRYIAYYHEPDPSGGLDGKVIRAELPVPADNIALNPGSLDVLGVVAPYISSHTTDDFQADGTAKKRVISSEISGFDVTLYDGSAGGNTGAAATVSYNIVVEAGNPASMNVRNGYYIKVNSRVSPRG